MLAFGLGIEAMEALGWSGAGLLRWPLAGASVLVGLALLAGFFTPIASASAAAGNLGAVILWIVADGGAESPRLFNVLFLSVISVALLLLGPGAFSLDARLFGRREIIIPESRRPPGS